LPGKLGEGLLLCACGCWGWISMGITGCASCRLKSPALQWYKRAFSNNHDGSLGVSEAYCVTRPVFRRSAPDISSYPPPHTPTPSLTHSPANDGANNCHRRRASICTSRKHGANYRSCGTRARGCAEKTGDGGLYIRGTALGDGSHR
jgi:hypothetical protein